MSASEMHLGADLRKVYFAGAHTPYGRYNALMSSSAQSKLTDSPWFWVYLFGAAALIAMFLIGNKADTVQAQRDGNFTRRQASLERQAGKVPPAASESESQTELQEPRYVDFTIFYGIIGAVTVFAWIMHWRQFLQRRSLSPPQQASA
jgi:hypothetical protein